MDFTEPAMRPPQEARSLLPRVTEGCTHNKCKFCNISRDYRFRAITPEDLDIQLEQLKPYYASNTPVYMCGSNPFALSARRLKEYIAVLKKNFPHFTRLSMQSRIPDIRHKSMEELGELRKLGLSHLYIGTENGNEEVLRRMDKGHTAKDTVEQLLRLSEAGITYTNFYVLGLGGKGKGRESALATAAMFNRVNPKRITTTGLTMLPNTEIAEMTARGEFVEASEREKIEELYLFLSNLETDSFYDGIHYLNPVNYRFHNKDHEAKREALRDMEDLLQNHSDEEIERMVNREMMKSL